MRHTAKIISTLLIFYFTIIVANSAIKGGVDYSIPIDYTKLNQKDLEERAAFYYDLAVNTKKINENMTSALVLYNILVRKEPQNKNYALHLGKLYDVIRKDRYARGYYFRAVGLDQKQPEPYYYLGEYYYDREQYRKALIFYKKAYDMGYSSHYPTLFKIADIYQKFGDTQNSLKYFQAAKSINLNEDVEQKLKQVEASDITNKEYYRK